MRHNERQPNPTVGDLLDLLLRMPGARRDEQRFLAAELDDDVMRADLIGEMWPKCAGEEAMHVQLGGQLKRVRAEVLGAAEALDGEHAELRDARIARRLL